MTFTMFAQRLSQQKTVPFQKPVRGRPHLQRCHAKHDPSGFNLECGWSRRGLGGAAAVALMTAVQPAQAIGFNKQLKKRVVPEEDYTVSEINGLKFFDTEEGRGSPIEEGDTVTVHFDTIFRGIDVSSSRSSRLLGGNRTIAEPFQFTAGKNVEGVKAKKISDSAGGLFSGQNGPKPPIALSTVVLGMKRGGKRLVIVDNPALGYGDVRVGEMPGGQTFQLKVEVLDVEPRRS